MHNLVMTDNDRLLTVEDLATLLDVSMFRRKRCTHGGTGERDPSAFAWASTFATLLMVDGR
jgi:hypothetical protein